MTALPASTPQMPSGRPQTTSERRRAWTGPALFSYGFRPFFLSSALWAALAMIAWIAMLSGAHPLPIALDPISWHAHAILFGYLSAVIAGFMTTAVPNWTGRLPIVGWPLAGLWALWLLGRLAVALSAALPYWAVICADMAFLLVFSAAITREIIAGKNWRNLSVVGLLIIFIFANLLFHLEVARGGFAAQGAGVRLGLSAALIMIALIGGRIVPSFTRNWLVKRGAARLPVPPMQRFDKLALLTLVAALLIWTVAPTGRVAAGALIVTGLLHTARVLRWRGQSTLAEPLVWVLHAGYACIPIGALLMGVAGIWPNLLGSAPAQHVWMAGAIGVMTLAVMTRASLGHTGRPLQASRSISALYWALILSVAARLAAGVLQQISEPLYWLSAAMWISAFFGFSAIYTPLLIRKTPQKSTPP